MKCTDMAITARSLRSWIERETSLGEDKFVRKYGMREQTFASETYFTGSIRQFRGICKFVLKLDLMYCCKVDRPWPANAITAVIPLHAMIPGTNRQEQLGMQAHTTNSNIINSMCGPKANCCFCNSRTRTPSHHDARHLSVN